MKSTTAVVNLTEDADAMKIALCVQTACRYRSRITLAADAVRMNAKSIMGMMALGLANGDSVIVEADGEDEDEAAKAIADFLEGK